jgi:hypothetical protein
VGDECVGVIQGHDDDDETAQDVQAGDPRGWVGGFQGIELLLNKS